MKFLIYWKWKVWQSVKDLLDKLKIQNVLVDDVDFENNLVWMVDFIVVSPWIKPTHKIYKIWKRKIIWELDVVNFVLNYLKKTNEYKFIWITWTDWKSTAVRKTYNILKKFLISDKYRVLVWWNFDIPVSKMVADSLHFKSKKVIVVEVSSFMAYNLKKLSFLASYWTNFAVDHLDWHADLDEYWHSKMNLFRLTQGLKVPNLGDNQKYRFFKTSVDDFVKFLKWILNYFWVNISQYQILKEIENIPSLPHRFEFVRKIDWIKIFDDWKCTTANCQAYALEQIDWKCILIAWWFDKGIDYSQNEWVYKSKVDFWVFFWDIWPKLWKLFDSWWIPNRVFTDFDEVVRFAFEVAKKRWINNILFSPGASSFDMFNNRKDRVERFLELVNWLN